MEDNTQELMEKHWLKDKKFSYGSYIGQARCAREIAIKKFGVEKVARMSDEAIEKEFVKEGLIPMCISLDNSCDYEEVYLVPIQVLDTFDCLSR